MTRNPQITGAILAGGRATRMNHQDKGLLLLGDEPLWSHIYRQLAPQVAEVVISANRHLDRYRLSGLKVIPDTLDDFPGPLAGMLAVLEATPREWALFCACDTPSIPADLAARLWQYHQQAPIVWLNDGERDHPTLALVHRRVIPALRAYLEQGERRVMQFFRMQHGLAVTIDTPISNLNTPADLAVWHSKED